MKWVHSLLAFVLVFSLAGDAFANRRRAIELSKEGTVAFKAGRYPKAIELYKRAFGESPLPKFMFAIGQAYRLNHDCASALFYYRRSVALTPDETERTPGTELDYVNPEEVSHFIVEQEAACSSKKPSPF